MSGIEFLPEADGDEPPDLAEPDFAPPRPARISRAARIAVVIVAAAGLVGWVATRPSDPSPATHPQAAATAATSATPSPTPTPAVQRPSASASWSTRNTTVIRCEIGAPLRVDIARPIYRYLKGITVALARTNRCTTGSLEHPKVLSESIIGHYRKITIEVALSRRDAKFPDGYEFLTENRRAVMRSGIETESAGIRIRVTSSGHGKWPTGFDIQALADYLSLNTVL